ncbi:flagellar hook capping FlgD N-terminal domain-containing protein [Cohnella yongneupensis]|uniref:Flagellar hook capping FlgD N-terminal domain-containing protein n=1 Tax=Cohnella yongneupensis TaxID=425006 RepID=A0ABW0R665_9BACL
MADSVLGTNNVWPNYATNNVQTAARTPTKELGKDQFLQILVTQLRNQDPMQPLQDKEFIAQMAQFSSLEQMMNMSKEVSSLRQSAGMVSGLIGKAVTWVDTLSDGTIQNRGGVVDSIVWRDGLQYATVQDSEVPIDQILSISEPSASKSEVDASE